MCFEPVTPESKLHQAEQADDAAAFEHYVKTLYVEDTQAALAWHAETYGNEYVECCVALLHGTKKDAEEWIEKRLTSLRVAVDEIVLAYAKEVLWPEQKKKLRV